MVSATATFMSIYHARLERECQRGYYLRSSLELGDESVFGAQLVVRDTQLVVRDTQLVVFGVQLLPEPLSESRCVLIVVTFSESL